MFRWPDVWQHNQFSHHQMIPDDYSLTSSQEWVRSWSQSSAQLSPTVSLSPPWPRWHVSDELSPALKDFTGTWLDEPHLSRGQIRLPRLFFNYSAGNRERFWVWTSQQWARWTNSEVRQTVRRIKYPSAGICEKLPDNFPFILSPSNVRLRFSVGLILPLTAWWM